jgi:hypothetical protein
MADVGGAALGVLIVYVILFGLPIVLILVLLWRLFGQLAIKQKSP